MKSSAFYALGFTCHQEGKVDGAIGEMVTELMNARAVAPVPFSESIAALLKQWRAKGIYIVADTSTLPGCENATIDFLQATYPDAFRGILLPRNHDGLGKVTKAGALEAAKCSIEDQFGFDMHSIPTAAIDDVDHHAAAFVEYDDNIQVFMPEYPWNASSENKSPRVQRIAQGLGTIDTLLAVDAYLSARL